MESSSNAKPNKKSSFQLQQSLPLSFPSPSLLKMIILVAAIRGQGASHIWFCGPIFGILVQPIISYHDGCYTSCFGYRHTSIAAGVALVATAVVLIGFAADVGHFFGDSMMIDMKLRAIVVFAKEFWILDVANNMS